MPATERQHERRLGALTAAITAARARVAVEAPDPGTAIEGEACVSRVVTAAMATAFMGHRLTQARLATALPVYGGPNPDYIISHALVDPGGRYRLAGRLNRSERAGVGLYRIGEHGAPLIAAYTAFDSRGCRPDGAFALDIGPDWSGPGRFAIPPGARILMVRVLHRDGGPPAQLTLSGGPDLRGPTLATGSNDGALAQVAATVGANIAEYMKWVAAARDLPNRLDVAPAELAETVIGDADTQYFLGGFDLGEGEWLEVVRPGSVRLPDRRPRPSRCTTGIHPAPGTGECFAGENLIDCIARGRCRRRQPSASVWVRRKQATNEDQVR